MNLPSLLTSATALLLTVVPPSVSTAADRPRILLDVDLCEDVDDAGALATLHALANRGEAEILGILISSRNEWVAPCADAINTWYGRPDLPIGYQRGLEAGYRNVKDPRREVPSRYAEAVARAFPHDLERSSDAPDAALLARRLLAAQPDQSVTVVTVGFLTNLRDLLDSRPDEISPLDGETLVQQKVKQWVCMGGIFPDGRFPGGQGEYNLMWDTAASVRAVNDWPTPVVFSGFAIGAAIKVGARLATTDPANPVRACYQHYNGLANREAWDQTAVLYAVRGTGDYWKLSEPGFCLMHARVNHGFNEWLPTAGKQHRYLIEAMAPDAVGKVIEDLMIAPPRAGNPVIQGWYADPEATVFGDRYWIYPTFSAPYDEQLHFDAFSSPDLIHWTRHSRILDNREVRWARRAMWAPAAVERGGKYYLFFAANDVHEGEVGGIGVAVANSPAGPFKDRLGRPLMGTIVNGAQPIDQFVFRDEDGQDYLVYGGWSHCNIAKLEPDFSGFIPFPDGALFKEITPERYVEGPCMFRRAGKLYFMWSEGGWTGPNYSVAYAMGDSPLGPFKRIGKILQQDRSVATGAGHHSVLRVPGADEWYIVYHRRPRGETDANHRVTCIDRMEFDHEGFIQPVKITFEGVERRPLKAGD
ncbi:MAG: family 43 glycosylhydrolase [Verrucomicrobiales bacterium]|nr:family 43 glycosylhydrolase [Verrucomicrobiales bacterium]